MHSVCEQLLLRSQYFTEGRGERLVQKCADAEALSPVTDTGRGMLVNSCCVLCFILFSVTSIPCVFTVFSVHIRYDLFMCDGHVSLAECT